MTDFEKLSNGVLDFFLWFFSSFLKGVNDFLFGNTIADGINKMISAIGGAMEHIGLGSLGVSQIALPGNPNNLIILVSITLFVGVGVGLVMLIKNLVFNWL